MTISIAEALAGTSTPAGRLGRRCKFGKLLDAVPADQASELVGRLHGDAWSDAKLAKLISGTAFGVIGTNTLGAHRNRDCICDTPTETSDAA